MISVTLRQRERKEQRNLISHDVPKKVLMGPLLTDEELRMTPRQSSLKGASGGETRKS